MIRFVLRFLGMLVLAAAFVALVYDGTRSIATNQIVYTPVDHIWTQLHAASLQALHALAEQHAPWLWDPGATALLNAPACLVLAVIGAVLMLLGRKKKPVIGYAR